MSELVSRYLGDVTVKIADRDHFTPTYVEAGVPMISPKDISSDEKIDFSNCKYITRDAHEHNRKKTDLRTGDLVFTRIGALLGKVCIVESWMPEFSILHSAAMLRANDRVIDPSYLMFFIKSHFFQSQIKNEIQSIGVPDLGLDKIKKFKIDFPACLNKQRKIAQILSTADAVIEKTRAAIAKYKAIKQGMLHDLFTRGIDPQTGTLRPHPDDAPELYQDSPLGKVPRAWNVKALDEITEYVDYRGKTPPKSEFGVFLVTARNIKDGFIDYEISREFIRADAFESAMSRGKARFGDVLITTEAPLGNVAQIDREDIALAQRVIKYRGFAGRLNNNFLARFLMADAFQRQLFSEATGSTVLGIKGSRLHKLKIIVPELTEQKSISQRLAGIDVKIQTEQNYLAKLQSIKAGLMADLLSGKKLVQVEG